MRMEDQRAILFTLLFWTVCGAAVWLILHYLTVWFAPFLFGVAIAALLRPAAVCLSKKSHLSISAAAGWMLFLFYLAAMGVFALFFTILLAQLYDLLARLPQLYAQSIAPLLTQFSDGFYHLAGRFTRDLQQIESFSDAVANALQQAAMDTSAHLVSWVAALAARLPMLLITAIFTVMISVLVSLNYQQVGAFLRTLIPLRFSNAFLGIQVFVRETLWQYLRAYTIIMAITFGELALGLWLLRFDYVLPVAAAITLLDLLPLIGSGTILVPWGLVLIAGNDLPGGMGLLMLFGIIAVVRNIIEPRVVGKQIGLHPIATITAMYVGLRIAGVIGMFAAPVAVLFIRFLQKNGANTEHT